MEEQILSDIKHGKTDSALVGQVRSYLKPILDAKSRSKLNESTGKQLCNSILRLLKQCREGIDESNYNTALIEIILLGCQGLQSLGYGYHDDEIVLCKVLHFVVVSMINQSDLLTDTLSVCDYLLEFLIQLDESGRLVSYEKNSPVARNTWSYLWNAFISRQKSNARSRDDFCLLSYAFRFYALVAEPKSLFDKFYVVVQKYLNMSESEEECIEGIVRMVMDLIKMLSRKFQSSGDENIRNVLCMSASLTMCITLNCDQVQKFSQILAMVAMFRTDDMCLNLFAGWKSKSLDLTCLNNFEAKTDGEMLCLTECLSSLLHQSPGNECLELMFFTHARIEFDSLKPSREGDKKVRGVVVASKICTHRLSRLTRLLTDNRSKYVEIKPEIDAFMLFLLEATDMSSKSFFTKKLHELACCVIRCAQNLKKSNMSQAVEFYESGVEILEVWADRTNRVREELWSFYYELSCIYYAESKYEKCLDLLENVIVHNRSNMTDVASMYVKCRKTADLLESERFLAVKIPDTDRRYSEVLKCEFASWSKYKISQVGSVMSELLEKILSVDCCPVEHGVLVLEKAIFLWSKRDYDSALSFVNESLEIIENCGGANRAALARIYIWKYVIYKSTLCKKYKIEQKVDDTDYKHDVNDFNERQDSEKSSLKFKDSFTLKEEHETDHLLVKALSIVENLNMDDGTPELMRDVGMLQGLFVLNGSFELSLKAAFLQKDDNGRLNQVQSYIELKQYEKAISALENCNDKSSVEWRLLKSKLCLSVGEIQEGYYLLEGLNEQRSEMATRLVGKLTALMAEYHRLPLDLLGAELRFSGENSNALFLSTFSFQCSQQAFNKASGLEPDKFGNLPELPDDKNLTLPGLMTQFCILNEYLNGLLRCSQSHYEVGESKYAKTYLQDALVLSLRFCLPKWTSRILTESAKLGILEGRVIQSEEKLRRAHWILNHEFTEIKSCAEEPSAEVKKIEVEVDKEVDELKCKAKTLLNEFGFDDGDDFIQSKCLKTNTALTKQEAHSLAGREQAVLIPANRSEACRTCGAECVLRRDLSLARLSVNILTVQSECFYHGGNPKGVNSVSESLKEVLDDYQHCFPKSAFKDLMSEQELTKAKSDSDGFDKLVESLQFASDPELIRCFQLLAEAYYYLGVRSMESYFSKPSISSNIKPTVKKTLMDQLCCDDENEEFQYEMQKEAKRIKAVSQKPINKNGRRKRCPVKPDVDEYVSEIKPIIPSESDGLSTPSDGISNVHILKKDARRLGKKVPGGGDSCSPEVVEDLVPTGDNKRKDVGESVKRKVANQKTGRKARAESEILVVDSSPTGEMKTNDITLKPPDAPKRGRRPKKNIDSNVARKARVTISPGEDSISIFTDNHVESADLSQLMGEMRLDVTPENARPSESISSDDVQSTARARKLSENKTPAVKTRTTRTRKNAVVEETPKPRNTRKSRAAKKDNDNVESLRCSNLDEEVAVTASDNIIGEFKEYSPKVDIEGSAALADVLRIDDDYFPQIEVLRGPAKTSTSKARRKVHGKTPISSSVTVESNRRRSSREVTAGRLSLEKAFNLLRHHPISPLYRDVCQALGVLTSSEDPWLSAYYFNEASCLAYRHETILALQKKRMQKRQMKQVNDTEETDSSVENSIGFPKGLDHFKDMISLLPSDWTIVIVSVVTSPLNSINPMYITRLRSNETPVIVSCPRFVIHGQSVIESFEETICDSRMRNSNCEDRVRWWTAKRIYSKSVETIVDKLENDIFSHYKGLLLGLYHNTDITQIAEEKSLELLNKFKSDSIPGDRGLLSIILQSLPYLQDEQIQSAVLDIFHKGNDSDVQEIVQELNVFKSSYPMTGKRDPVILILDKMISHLPFENMPVLSENSVVRALSIYSLHCQFLLNSRRKEELRQITGPDMSNISYILDPEYNLPNTRQQFADWFSQLGWVGSVGKKPSREEFEKHLTQSDMMLYLGHGSGQRYVDGTRIQKLCCRAAVILMGCSSGALKISGQMEPRGMILNYLMARSPFVMGNLWDVTDGDIDRFTKALLEYWLSAEPGTMLLSAVHHARSACRLRYLTGGAPVMYGLPL